MPGHARPNLSNLRLGQEAIGKQLPVSVPPTAANSDAVRQSIVANWRQTFNTINDGIAESNRVTTPYQVNISVEVGGIRREVSTLLNIGWLVPGLPMPTTIYEAPGIASVKDAETGVPLSIGASDIQTLLVPVVQILDPVSRAIVNVGMMHPYKVCNPVDSSNFGCLVDGDGYLRFETPPVTLALSTGMAEQVTPDDYFRRKWGVTTNITGQVARIEFQYDTEIDKEAARQRFEVESIESRNMYLDWYEAINDSNAYMAANAGAAGFAAQ